MDELLREVLAGEEAYIVGGAVRDEALGRPLIDVDVACRDPERAARTFRQRVGGAVFLLSERHAAWRVAPPHSRTTDFTLLVGTIEEDLEGRDFTINAIAVPLGGGDPVDPHGGYPDLAAKRLRPVHEGVFREDPLRLLRAVRLEDELGVRLEPAGEELVRRHAALVVQPAGERVLAELLRLSAPGWARLDELGLLRPLGGSLDRLVGLRDGASPELLLVAGLGRAALRLPLANHTRRLARTLLAARPPEDTSARALHRFRRRTEPWALDVLEFMGLPQFREAVEASRAADPAEALLRGDELGVPSGPEVGRLLDRIAEERAAGTIQTREQALELVRRERR